MAIDMDSRANPLQLQLIDEQVPFSKRSQLQFKMNYELCFDSQTSVVCVRRTRTFRAEQTRCRTSRAPLWNWVLSFSSWHTWSKSRRRRSRGQTTTHTVHTTKPQTQNLSNHKCIVCFLLTIRIDGNVEDTQLNVEMAHTEILKYFQSVSSNRWLMIKIFLVLIVFFIIFVVFLA